MSSYIRKDFKTRIQEMKSFFDEFRDARAEKKRLSASYEEAINNYEETQQLLEDIETKYEELYNELLLSLHNKKISSNGVDLSKRIEQLDKADEIVSKKFNKYTEIINNYNSNMAKYAPLKAKFVRVGALVMTPVISASILAASHAAKVNANNNTISNSFELITEYPGLDSNKLMQDVDENEKGKDEQEPEEKRAPKFSELNYKEMNKLALDTLKARLAEHYGVENAEDFTVYYHWQDTQKKIISNIKYKGSIIADYEQGQIPKEVFDIIEQISLSQNTPVDPIRVEKNMLRALRHILELDPSVLDNLPNLRLASTSQLTNEIDDFEL